MTCRMIGREPRSLTFPRPALRAYGSLLSFLSLRLAAIEEVSGARTTKCRSAPGLIHVDGGDQHRADRNALPERLHTDDDETRLKHRGDEQADDGAEDAAFTTEDRCASDHHGSDHVEVGQRLPGDCG